MLSAITEPDLLFMSVFIRCIVCLRILWNLSLVTGMLR